MKRMEPARLGRLAATVRRLRETRKALEGKLAAVNAELAEKEPVFLEQMHEPQLVAGTVMVSGAPV